MPLLKSYPPLSALRLFSENDKDYLAYRVGLSLVEDSNFPGSIKTTASSITVGTFTDTYDAAAVGTPRTSITSIATTLYSNDSATSESSITKLNQPLRFDLSTNDVNIASKLGTDSDLNIVSDQILSNIMTNEYPGTFRLGFGSPGADWSVYIANVFVDNLVDNATSYNIYRRNTITAPQKAAPLKLGYSGVTPVSFVNMSDSDIKTVFGTRVKNRILSTGVGLYQLRDDIQGAPTDPGTWAVRGYAYDTINTTTAISYQLVTSDDYTLVSSYLKADVDNYTLTEDLPYTSISNFTGSISADYTTNYDLDVNYSLSIDYTGSVETQINYIGVETNYTGQVLAPGINYTSDPANFLGPVPADYTTIGSFVTIGAGAVAYDGAGTLNYSANPPGPAVNYSTIFPATFTGPGPGPANYTGPGAAILYTGPGPAPVGYLGDANYVGLSAPINYTLTIVYVGPGTIGYVRDPIYVGPAIPTTYSGPASSATFDGLQIAPDAANYTSQGTSAYDGVGIVDVTSYNSTVIANYSGPGAGGPTILYNGPGVGSQNYTGVGPVALNYTSILTYQGINPDGIAYTQTLFYTGEVLTNIVYTGPPDYTGPGIIPAVYNLILFYDAINEYVNGYVGDAIVNYTGDNNYSGLDIVNYTGDTNYSGLTNTAAYSQDIIYSTTTTYNLVTLDVDYVTNVINPSNNYNNYISPDLTVRTYTLYCRVS